MMENEWRMEYCPTASAMYCDCPFEYGIDYCEGAWDCEDLAVKATSVMEYYD
jgi:hypothetical protein